MNEREAAMQALQNRALGWAESRDDIRTVLLIGSWARYDHLPDKLSDIDLVLFTTDIEAYHVPVDWSAEIGPLWLAAPNPRSDGYPEYLVMFEHGHKLDFNFFPMSMLEALISTDHLPNVYHRGYKILLDKDGLAGKIPPSSFASPVFERPTDDMFRACMDHFWFNATLVAKCIWRKELWLTKIRDQAMKVDLLQMIEWYAQGQHDWNYDTWHRGRFMAEWADPQLYEALSKTFAHYDTEDSQRALMVSMELFRQLATDTAGLLGYTYPVQLDQHITQYIHGLWEPL